uniref:Cysteine desulfurase 1ic isoform X1 n=1 Tax=Rhizophora mucronata TaxID=61149 RepID=A0A2P2L5X8_RHIMU
MKAFVLSPIFAFMALNLLKMCIELLFVLSTLGTYTPPTLLLFLTSR